MLARLGVLVILVALYLAGQQLGAMHLANPQAHAVVWTMAGLMVVTFLVLVACMYTRVLPALLALPILAVALASIAGMPWQVIFTKVLHEGGFILGKWIIAAILGSILAQIVEKTGIAQTVVKKTAELGGDRPWVLTILLTLVIGLLFVTLTGLGSVIMVATIAIPILLSLGLRPLYVGCLFLLAMSLGGTFNLVNWEGFKTTLKMTNVQIGAFALPFAGLMLLAIIAFMLIEGKRLGKARYKATVDENAPTQPHAFVPWYAMLTPIVPLVPVLFFALLPKVWARPAEVTVTLAKPKIDAKTKVPMGTASVCIYRVKGAKTNNPSFEAMHLTLAAGDSMSLTKGTYEAIVPMAETQLPGQGTRFVVEAAPWTKTDFLVESAPNGGIAPTVTPTPVSTIYDFPISVALLLGILYGAITTWRRGQSTVQLVTKASFDGVTAVGPALVLLMGIGMVYNATNSDAVGAVINPMLQAVVPHGVSALAMVKYILIFGILAPLALYRGPLNLYGMGASLMVALNGMGAGGIPTPAIMGAFMTTGMVQGVSDPTNTHNVWIANYTNTDVQEILKRTLPYMWILSFIGLALAGFMYYR